MLPRIDLDLEAQPQRRGVLGVETVDERDAALALLPLRLAEPRIEDFPQRAHERPGRFWVHLHEVDILGVARRWPDVQLVERCAATKGERPRQKWMREYGHQGTGDHEVLLDLGVRHPWRFLAPFGDVVAGNHTSASTSALTANFHAASRRAFSTGAPGSSATGCLATAAT
jgi:hypothetical protein